ncbi:MAG: hypothetical protein COC19_01550 [SAR86 cluster bacterium]|uniref:Uncharacterized protein n=1 Tax=SAR86 cluster bacterium TaxID=2030880 RepID=A0A2A4MSQ9_9GAMM|nr:MAG: hypothetical protein COC19_01550 [SAR86 cluster bacterium]
MSLSSWTKQDIRLYAVLISLLISCYTILFPDLLNDDAYVYRRTAEIFLEQGLLAAFEHYTWAAYSIVIALVSELFNCDLFTAAYLINGIFSAIIVFAFISIVKEIDNDKTVLLLAAICVLVYPQLNEYRYEVIRDLGYWAFSLVALWQLILFMKAPSLQHGLGFCVAIMLASVLRIEALLYLIISPLCVLLDGRHHFTQRLRHFLLLLRLVVGLSLTTSALLFLLNINVITASINFLSTYLPFVKDLFNPDSDDAFAQAQILFNEHAANYSQRYISLFIASGLFAIVAAKLISGFGLAFLGLLVFGVRKVFAKVETHLLLPLVAFLLINMGILFSFIFITRFLSTRYTMLFCLILTLFIPIILHRILLMAKRHNRGILAARAIAVFLLYCGIDAYISFGLKKTYIADSVDWIENNTPSSAMLLTNNNAVAFYSGKIQDYDKIGPSLSETQILGANAGTYLAIEMNDAMRQILNNERVAQSMVLRKAFPDEVKQRIMIFEILN